MLGFVLVWADWWCWYLLLCTTFLVLQSFYNFRDIKSLEFISICANTVDTTWFVILASASEPQTPAQNIDYNFARDELMLNELSNDPIQAAISRLEKQHEEDKQGIIKFF